MEVSYNNIFINLHEALKQKRGKDNIEVDYNTVANSTINVGYLDRKKIKRVIIYLRSKGCEWSCKTNGGCFMCGHYFGTSKGKELPKNSFVNQFKKEFVKYDYLNIPIICIYNAGSILNNQEIENDELLEILKIVSQNKHIKRIIIESRPEFINHKILSRISDSCQEQIIEIGIGLETAADDIRNKCINKGFTFNSYIESVCKIRKFSNIKVLTYITVKPLFLTINEGIEDVINSIRAISDYTDIISLEPVSIQKNTLTEYLYKNKLYTLSKGWMVKDIIMRLSDYKLLDEFELRIGGFEFYPIPDLVISNCELCNKKLYNAIDSYNSTKNIKALRELTCTCEEEYLKEKFNDKNKYTLDERINKAMNCLLKGIIE